MLKEPCQFSCYNNMFFSFESGLGTEKCIALLYLKIRVYTVCFLKYSYHESIFLLTPVTEKSG